MPSLIGAESVSGEADDGRRLTVPTSRARRRLRAKRRPIPLRMDDPEAAADEILALQAIFADSFSLGGPLGDPSWISGTIRVPIQLPEEIHAIVRTWKPEKSHDELAIALRWLPPVEVLFALPPDYPSKRPPDVVVTCRWLLPEHRLRVQQKLFDLWESCGHGVALFELCSFLQNELLDTFGLLSPDGRKLDILVDEREQSIPELVDSLTEHERKMAREEFESESFHCGVCFEPRKGAACVRFVPCRHVFCKDCTREFFTVLVKDNRTDALRCPDTTCGKSQGANGEAADPGLAAGHLEEADLADLLGDELYRRYRELYEKNELSKRRDIAWCPRGFCQGLALKDKQIEKLASCTQCSFAFCHVCQRSWHGTSHCAVKNLQKTVEEFMRARDSGDRKKVEALEFRYGAKVLARLVADYESEKESLQWKRENTMPCPTCGTDIERTEGCNHMHCPSCGDHFCYLCGRWLNPSRPYVHFNDPKSPCNQLLFFGSRVQQAADEDAEAPQVGDADDIPQDVLEWALG
ncbi:hypothetical protein DFJ74DRAFT_688788 [Hyaloraphidium curvatum]|nr:hypothetical protein DFJ74DRAFT_688788 [Hyaloraphidium curvatum]